MKPRVFFKRIFFRSKVVVIVVLVLAYSAFGEDSNPTPPSSDSEHSQNDIPAQTDTPDVNPAKTKKTSQRTKGKVYREKEAEGSQAPNRFESVDPIPKSAYQDERTGQHYEVDTD